MSVLICTAAEPEDPCIGTVRAAIEARGGVVHLLDTGRYPLDASTTTSSTGSGRLVVEGQAIDLASIRAVWIRHTAVGAGLDERVHRDYHEAVRLQSDLAFWDALGSIDAFFLDHPDALSRFPLGLRQLRLARDAGLRIPRTLITADPAAVRALAADCGGELIAKMLHSSLVLTQTAEGISSYRARRIGPEHLDQLERLTLCPMIFQEPIPRSHDIRATVVGGRIFAAEVETGSATVCDWADDPALVRRFTPCTLPEPVAAALLRLLDALGLNFAAADLIRTPDGRYVFLEVGAVSYFDFIERACGLPISDAVAALLLGEQPPRRVRR